MTHELTRRVAGGAWWRIIPLTGPTRARTRMRGIAEDAPQPATRHPLELVPMVGGAWGGHAAGGDILSRYGIDFLQRRKSKVGAR